jgi:hypothetical protein
VLYTNQYRVTQGQTDLASSASAPTTGVVASDVGVVHRVRSPWTIRAGRRAQGCRHYRKQRFSADGLTAGLRETYEEMGVTVPQEGGE